MDDIKQDDYLMHYGTPRHSGRYPYGSGDNPYQHTKEFYGRIKAHQEKGLDYTQIAKKMSEEDGCTYSSTYIRNMVSMGKRQADQENITRAKRLKEKGYSNTEIGKKMGVNESTVRGWLAREDKIKENAAEATANILKKRVGKDKYVMVGEGAPQQLGISKEKMKTALEMLKQRGYVVTGDSIRIPQPTNPDNMTTIKLLCPPGTTNKEIYNNLDRIVTVEEFSHDGGETFKSLQYPSSVSSDRISIRYAEEGGLAKDGTIEIRRGVADLNLGNAKYAQVRIAVDDSHYIKGMAFYSDNMPEGKDIVFNTNKHEGTPMCGPKDNSVFKPLKKDDPDNPFGSYIKADGQSYYTDSNGKEQLSAINKVREEGDWEKYTKTLSAQFLSKQPLKLVNRQLQESVEIKEAELDEIKSLTIPEIKKNLLASYADDCDSNAVSLKATSLPRQSSKVILPLEKIKDTEVYAPTYNNGEQVALIRYPHGGTFEIPILTVNNKNAEGKAVIGGEARDCIGINSTVSGKLSGADFDGDTVMVIPLNDRVKVKATETLKGLKDFDPKESYPKYEGMKVMTKQQTQIQMGIVSNLITDMTIKGASPDELARAVRHSMVVIDANKHELDYKRSEQENRIQELKEKYQNGGGASTLISMSKSEYRAPEYEKADKYKMSADPKTGKMLYVETGGTHDTYKKNSNGTIALDDDGKPIILKKDVPNVTITTKMAYTDDARTLSSGTPVEESYAKYANTLKGLANEARKEYMATENTKVDREAKKKYSAEVEALTEKVNKALMNTQNEKMAQIRANRIIKDAINQDEDLMIAYKTKKGPDMDRLKKLRNRALTESRSYYNSSSKSVKIVLTDREWDAIQNRAVSSSLLNSILRFADADELRKRATPRSETTLSNAQIARIQTLKNSGFTIAEIAKAVGVSTSTVATHLD